MGKFYRELDDDLRKFIRRQRMFFTATAPSDGARINLSPKGYDSLALLDPRTLAYYDLPGSGNETANHLLDNGRLTLMWCAFAGKPLILRAYCQGEVIPSSAPRFTEMMETHWPEVRIDTVRQIFVGHIEALQTSCGYGVPLYDYRGDRSILNEWASTKANQGKLEEYMEKNAVRNDAKFPIEPLP